MMNPELMQMLEEAGFIFTPDVMNKLPAFEKLVQLEREACAKVCEAIAQEMYDQGEGPTGYISWVADCHLRIRARGHK